MLESQFWHVCYLKPRSEKTVQKKIEELHFTVFLPLINHFKIYKTSKRNILLPLFPGYIFVNIAPGYRHHITAIPEVYKFIKFRDEFARISNQEILNLQILVRNVKEYSELYSEVIFQKGRSIIVTEGPFRGMKGKMICRKGKKRISIEIDSIKQSISIEIDAKFLHQIGHSACNPLTKEEEKYMPLKTASWQDLNNGTI